LATDFTLARHQLVEHLRREVRDKRVLAAMTRVPREMFVPTSYWGAAYEDRPLPIGHGQTISQPLIVALMTEALELEGQENVLEVGTGSGYQAAILAELAKWVVTVERHAELAQRASETLKKLGYTNVEVHLAEARLGWPPKAPYNAIVVSAGAPTVPKDLLDQLAVGGRLVIPVGPRYEQNLLKVVKKEHDTAIEDMGPCRWVPLIGDAAWDEENA
jgi:protein-L-isoaspartate(D-aspartate) O-methyltransferase